jgi:hypothetical protein
MMEKLCMGWVPSLAHLLREYDYCIEGSPEMMVQLVLLRFSVQVVGRNTGKLKKVAAEEDVEIAEYDVVFGGVCRTKLVVELDHHFAIQHADFIDY